ncbi:MAG: hypothetical protein PHT11_08000 [Synergistaceae bacterium]|nr:hypothetical protein [Synergistaceae bacterium]
MNPSFLNIFDSFRRERTGTMPLRRYFPFFLVLLLLLAAGFPAAGAVPSPDDVPPGTSLRWVNSFYMTVPSDWKPMLDRDGLGFYTGSHPETMDDPSTADLPLVALGVTRQKAPKGGGYRAFFEEMERSAAKEKAKNFTSKEEEITIGSHPAVFYSFSADTEIRGKTQRVEMNLVVAKEPDAEGNHILVMIGGKTASIEKYRDVIKTMLSSVREGVPPLEKTLSFPFGATQEAFRHSEGPFVAADGTVAVLDRFGKRIRLFDAAGTLVDEWGEKGRGEDGTFAWPTVIAFAPDGSLYVADEGYSVDANIQHFSRKGKFLGKIKADRKTLGEKGIYKPDFLAVTETGKIITGGSSEIKDGKPRVLVFSPDGKLQASWDLETAGPTALLPEEKLVLVKPQQGDDRADIFAVYDLEGNLLKEWPLWGSDLPALPGDDKIYFRVKYVGTDAEGRVYAFDDSEDGIWIYDREGRYLQVVSARRTFGIMEGMAVLPNGDVIIKDRPSGYGPGEPSIHRMKNAFPAKVLPVAEKTSDGHHSIETPSGQVPETETADPETSLQEPGSSAAGIGKTESLEEELTRLKKALSLREAAVSLEEAGDFAGAAAKYRESLTYHDDPAVKEYAEGLELRAALPQQPEKQADLQPAEQSLREEPKEDPKEKPKEEPKEESKEEPKEESKEEPKEEPPLFIDLPPLDSREQAEAIWMEAAELQKAKKYEEALQLYRKGLGLSPDDTVRAHVARLEVFIPKAKEKAEAIWRRAGELQNAKKYTEALRKYREGLDIYHNQVVADHVLKLDTFIRRQK